MSTESDILRDITALLKSIRARLRSRGLYDASFSVTERAMISETIDDADRAIARTREARRATNGEKRGGAASGRDRGLGAKA